MIGNSAIGEFVFRSRHRLIRVRGRNFFIQLDAESWPVRQRCKPVLHW